MAGHSKWANIKHRKGKADAAKGKVFSRIAKEIISAVKVGGSADPKMNPRLRLVLQKAREANVPNEIIDRNIKKGTNVDQADYSEVTYEIYGYGGVGIIVEGLTDNRNRFASDIRIAINKKGGNIANPGSVAFNFDRKGIIQISKKHAKEEDLFAAALEAGAQEFDVEQDLYIITTDPIDLIAVKDAVEKLGFKSDEANLELVPKSEVETELEAAKDNMALIEWLEELDDVDSVYHNMKLPEELA